jgi:aryl sulfotransferase
LEPTPPAVRYQSTDEDSGRWLGFPFRPGDIVISTRSKSGTTWMQMICALLIFQTPDLPAPLRELSPWLDWLVNNKDEVWARLEAQRHRRFIKTHTPLDGVPLHPEVTYIVVARHPLDAAESLYHQGDNLDRKRMRELSGQPEPTEPPEPRLPLHDWLVDWIERDTRAEGDMDSLPGVMHHLSDAWARRLDPNVVLVHYDDLQADLDGRMRMLAARLDISIDETVWPSLVKAATFDEMQSNAEQLTPDVGGIFRYRAMFFRGGRSGSGAQLLSDGELRRYHARSTALAPADLLAWLHMPR